MDPSATRRRCRVFVRFVLFCFAVAFTFVLAFASEPVLYPYHYNHPTPYLQSVLLPFPALHHSIPVGLESIVMLFSSIFPSSFSRLFLSKNKSLSRQHHKAQALIHLRLLKLLDSTALERTRQTLASSSSSSSSLRIFSPSANHSGGSKGTFTKSMSNIYDQQRRAKRDRQLQSSEGEERRRTSMYCSSEYRCLVGPAKERYCE